MLPSHSEIAGVAGVGAGVEVLVGEVAAAREEAGIAYWCCSRPLECSGFIGMGWALAYAVLVCGGREVSGNANAVLNF